ncbi:metallophosphoesterase [Kaistella yonginensis]|uniref:metallophosphoesterase n=1 Tax=Kaistella yonginensis TaxID=658267 RepID=UPI0025B57819|nr:metallophosphoesterase [Kaistella yonginensis]MDN3607930.1 metallophosphoesterase [Kaistella yonginensis]
MLKTTLTFILLIFSFSCVFSQNAADVNENIPQEISDGPYIFIEPNNLVEKTIVDGKVVSKILDKNAFDTVFTAETETFKNVKNIAALSDIHGQYDLAVELLKNNKIIDKNLNWNFGKGHLVLVGDIFDRGSKVNEMLWLLYKLENQAKKKGGKVHFLLGNHEYMVLHQDLRYINEKYKTTSTLLNLPYDKLYSNKTVLGRWLRSKPTMIKINNSVFVHGGISKDFLAQKNFNIDEINDTMRKSIDRSKKEMKSTNFYDEYYGKKSLIWYRGYFNDNLQDTEISEILNHIKSEHIIVGHCSNEEVVQLFDGKIYGVDSSIKKGKYGEILFIENNQYSRRMLDGQRKPFTGNAALKVDID